MNNNPIGYTDPLGLETVIKSKDIVGGFGTHTFTEVRKKDKKNKIKRITFSGTRDKTKEGKLLGVKENYGPDYNLKKGDITSEIIIKPPKGMTQQQWDQAKIGSGLES